MAVARNRDDAGSYEYTSTDASTNRALQPAATGNGIGSPLPPTLERLASWQQVEGDGAAPRGASNPNGELNMRGIDTVGTSGGTSQPIVLFIAAHPDDETLCMGSAIADHVSAGREVHVLLLTRGTTSVARSKINGETLSRWWRIMHHPEVEGYRPLDEEAFGKARLAETLVAMRSLSGASGLITVHDANLRSQTITLEMARNAILALADAVGPGREIQAMTHSHLVDDHPDHLAAGGAVRQLQVDQPRRFRRIYHFVLPAYWNDPRLKLVTNLTESMANADNRARVINACRAYGAWAPPHSYAIGRHSTPALFDQIEAEPKCLIHS